MVARKTPPMTPTDLDLSWRKRFTLRLARRIMLNQAVTPSYVSLNIDGRDWWAGRAGEFPGLPWWNHFLQFQTIKMLWSFFELFRRYTRKVLSSSNVRFQIRPPISDRTSDSLKLDVGSQIGRLFSNLAFLSIFPFLARLETSRCAIWHWTLNVNDRLKSNLGNLKHRKPQFIREFGSVGAVYHPQ